MKLSDYLSKTKTERKDFASAIGVDPITVWRWERGHRVPIHHFAQIAKLTKGKVTANDFVEAAQ
jgi:transcriptional regulator with XRE-family HTH domain